jgi:hypothetical protein
MRLTLNNRLGLRCKLGLCPCRWHGNAFGCGGKCVACGQVVGWMTRNELREVGDRAIEQTECGP